MRSLPRWALVSAVLFLLFSMAGALTGCSGEGGGLSGRALALVKKVPGDTTEFTLLDLKALRAGDGLEGLYESAAAQLAVSQYAVILPASVDLMVLAGGLTIMEGRFDLPSLEQQLKDGGYEERDYQGTPLWVGSSSSVALVSSSCLVAGGDSGELAACVDVVNGGGGSVYDNPDVKGLVDRLPGGFALMVFAGGEAFGQVYYDVRAIGYCLAGEGRGQARMAVVFAFGEEPSARESQGNVAEMLTYGDGGGRLQDVSVARDGRFVKATARMSLEDAVD